MDGFELYELGRELMQTGENGISYPSGSRPLAPGVLTVMTDVFEPSERSVSGVVGRTGFSAGQVAAFRATISDLDALTTAVATAVNPDVPGRTVVRPVPGYGAAPRVGEQLAAAAGCPRWVAVPARSG